MSLVELFHLRIIKLIFKRAALLHCQGIWPLAELISYRLQVTLSHSKIPEKIVIIIRNKQLKICLALTGAQAKKRQCCVCVYPSVCHIT